MITVIIPAYNSEKYLPACLDSLTCNSATNMEFILVNDGSTDSTACICDAFCVERSNARAIHRENGGLPAARNTGVTVADDYDQDEWIWFVDSDDIVAPDALEILERYASETSADAIHFGSTSFNEGDLPIWKRPANASENVISAQEFLSGTYSSMYDHYLWSFLFRRRTFLRLVEWREGCGMTGLCDESYSLLEDLVFVEELMQEACRDVLCVSNVLYGYRQMPASMSHAVNPKAADSALRALRYIDRFEAPAADRRSKRLMQIALLFNAYRAAGQSDGADMLRKEIRAEIDERVQQVGLAKIPRCLLFRYAALRSGLGDAVLKRRGSGG